MTKTPPSPPSVARMLGAIGSSIIVLASCGGGSRQIRPMIAEGRWIAACELVHPAELSTEDLDMSPAEFDRLVVERSAPRIAVEIVPRHVLEHIMGGSRAVRASARETQGRDEPDSAASATSRSFVARHVMFLWRVESSGPIHVELTPALTRRSGSSPIDVARIEPFASPLALARGLGFSRDPGGCDNSVLAVGSRLVDSIRPGYSPDALCSSREGRTPTADEQALVKDIATRLIRRCPAGESACTGVALASLPSAPTESTEVDTLDLRVELPIAPGCGAFEHLEVPLPTTDVTRAEVSLRSLFPKGPRSLSELAGIKSGPPGAPVEPNNEPCQNECRSRGACTEKGGHCFVGSDADCKASRLCEIEGWCSAVSGSATPNPPGAEWITNICAAKTDADCASAEACRAGGDCHADAGACVAKSAADCRASKACARYGLCSFAGGACLATADADCKSSGICAEWHACRLDAGLCR